jgi:hypothetical protein
VGVIIGDPIIEYLINHGLIPENCVHFVMEVKVGEPIKLHYSVYAEPESNLQVLMGGVELLVEQESEEHLR